MLVVYDFHRDQIVPQGISFIAFYDMEKESKNNTWVRGDMTRRELLYCFPITFFDPIRLPM